MAQLLYGHKGRRGLRKTLYWHGRQEAQNFQQCNNLRQRMRPLWLGADVLAQDFFYFFLFLITIRTEI